MTRGNYIQGGGGRAEDGGRWSGGVISGQTECLEMSKKKNGQILPDVGFFHLH